MLGLLLIVLAHFVNHLLGLLRPKVRLVVLLIVVAVLSALLTAPFHLHLNEILVLLESLVSLGKLFSHLMLVLLDAVDKLSLFSFAKLL